MNIYAYSCVHIDLDLVYDWLSVLPVSKEHVLCLKGINKKICEFIFFLIWLKI